MPKPRHRRTRFSSVPAALAACLLLASAAGAQYGDWGVYEEPAPAPTRPPQAAPTPVPTPKRAGEMTLAVSARHADGATTGRRATVQPGEALGVRIRVGCSARPGGPLDITVLPLDEGAGMVIPSRGSVGCGGTWQTTLQAGNRPGSYTFLVAVRDPSGTLPPASTMIHVAVQAGKPRLAAGGALLSPEPRPNGVSFRSRTRSWRAAIELRNFIYSDWNRMVAERLVAPYSTLAEAMSRAVAIDREKIGLTGHWPKRETFRSYARLEGVMSKYWANGGLTLSAATANEVGNVFLAWRNTPGLTVTLDEGVAKAAGAGGHVIKVGRILNGVGFTMILLDFWNNATSAETPVEAREAWQKAGYSSLDMYVANVVGDTFGAAAALPGMFVSYILTNAYDTLIGGYKACWFKKMVEIAAAEHYLGDGIRDTAAVNRVLAAMKSPRGLRGTLIDWWRGEAPTWAGKMGGCGNWDLAEARGYTEAFVDRLMRTREVEVHGHTYYPWAFYWAVSRKLVKEREEKLALEAARDLNRLEAAYLAELHRTVYRARLRVVADSDPDLPIAGATLRPVDWSSGSGWRSDGDGWLAAELRGDDFSPSGLVAVLVRTESGRWVFAVPQSTFREVSR